MLPVLRIKETLILGIILSMSFILLAFVQSAHAQPFNNTDNPLRGSMKVSVSATVGEFFLNLSGYASPFASITLTTDGIFLRSTTADQNGDFHITDVLINRGFSHFCLESVDRERIGTSNACFNIPPAQGSLTMSDIFLPPTLGLSKTEIPEGSDVWAFGYTMPGAIVTLYLSNNQILTTKADQKGYYKFKISNLKAGVYVLYTKAFYNNLDSVAPSKKITLKSLSLWDQFVAFIKQLLRRLWLLLTSIPLGPLWAAVPIIILIIILIGKLWPEAYTWIYTNAVFVFFVYKLFRRQKKHLHHYWLVGE